MSARAALSDVQAVRLRQFVEQADARLSHLTGSGETAPTPARVAEIARLERLRGIAQWLLDEAEAAVRTA